MKIALAQIKPAKGNIAANIESHKKWISKAIDAEVDLIVFPELSLTGYEPELAKELAFDQNDPRLDDFQKISNQQGISISAGLPIKASDGIKISMIIFRPDQPCITYFKQQLHTDELPYFTAGNEQVILEQKGSNIAPAICYESLQENHLSNCVELGAGIYLASVAKSQNGIEKAYDHFPKMARKYSVLILMVNSVGFCDNFLAAGQSAVWDEKGDLLGRLDTEVEGLLMHDTFIKKASSQLTH